MGLPPKIQMMSMVLGLLPLNRINPMVGDSVRVYHDTKFEIWMKVQSRKWQLTNGSSPKLIVELGLPDCYETLLDFEEDMRKNFFKV